MTRISQKCQYALRTLLELAKQQHAGPLSVSAIAAAQAIPPRFLELIVRDLRQAGLLKSRRGVQGGYTLAADPRKLTVGRIVRMFNGPLGPVDCEACGGRRTCPLKGNCVFVDMWNEVRNATAGVYDNTTFHDLLQRALAAAQDRAIHYSI